MTGPEPRVEVRLLEEPDAPALLRFEEENRAFFEATLPPRPQAYYALDHVQRTITASIEEVRAGTAFMYVVLGADGEIVGRVNLFGVARGPVQGAELGNGFQFWGRARRSLLVHGTWIDSVCFERHRHDAREAFGI